MAKNSFEQIKKDEQRVLDELSDNANNSVNEIAKKCGFSRQKVWRIIKNLESDKTIWGYATVTDKDKLNKKEFVLLIKRSNLSLTKNVVNKIIQRELDIESKKIGIDILSSVYVNGIYDWIICFTAEDIKGAKRFCENLNKTFEGFISEVQLLEKMFAAKKSGIENPDIKKLGDFFNL